MNPLTKRHITVVALLALVFAFAAYHDKPSDTDDESAVALNVSDAQAAAMVAGLGRK